jgi:hypothetical protein
MLVSRLLSPDISPLVQSSLLQESIAHFRLRSLDTSIIESDNALLTTYSRTVAGLGATFFLTIIGFDRFYHLQVIHADFD